MGDSFPALKRAVTKGTYPSLPKKYSSALNRTIALMLKQNYRERAMVLFKALLYFLGNDGYVPFVTARFKAGKLSPMNGGRSAHNS
jgi:hypothetical protein